MNRLTPRTLSVQNFDLILFLSVIILSVIGVFFIYSSAITSQGQLVSNEYIKQIIWVVTGVGLLLFFAFMDYRRLKLISPIIYLVALILLGATLLFGSVVNGAKSWLGIGSLGIQPSEFTKLATIIYLASYLEDNMKELDSFKTFFTALGIAGLPASLILLQPDLGTAMVFIPIVLVMLFIAGSSLKYLGFIVLTGIVAVFCLFFYAWNSYINPQPLVIGSIFTEVNLIIMISLALLGFIILTLLGRVIFKKSIYFWFGYGNAALLLGYLASLVGKKVLQGYQLMRLVVFMDPQVDPRGAGWNIIQSVTAVGSGGFLGKGYLQGTQSHYRFLPQQSTDFIFSILAEELGFAGSLLIFTLFSIILFRMLYIVFTSRDHFGALIAAGLAGFIAFHVIENIGMAIGIMPITGIPLIFLSYGGSSLWTVYMGIGILLSIHQRRYRS